MPYKDLRSFVAKLEERREEAWKKWRMDEWLE